MLALACLVLLQDSGDVRIQHLIDALSDDSPQVRERAQADLLSIGAPAYPALKRALESSDSEIRARVELLLNQGPFLRVPQVIAKNIERLGSDDRKTWHDAVDKLVRAGDKAVEPLRASGNFRATQLADILQIKPVNGLRWGVVVENEAPDSEGNWPAIEVFINASSNPITFELGVDGHCTFEGKIEGHSLG